MHRSFGLSILGGLLLTYPLYLGHAVFLLNVAFLWKKTSPRQLYFFGMLFGLYEALITKVLWFGYPASTGPMVGYFFGVAWGEFLTLVLFYHPIMSFVVPIFVYEVLSGDVLPGHERFLQRNWKTLLLVMILIVMGASFQSNGAGYDLVQSVGSMGGSILIVVLLHFLSRGKNLQSLVLGKKGLTIVLMYLFVLYGVTTVVIFPERLPKIVIAYVLIVLWYLVAIGLLWVDRFTPAYISVKRTMFSQKELGIFAIVVVGATVVCSVFQQVTYGVLLTMFVSLMGAGVILFIWSVFSLMRQRISQKLSEDL
ncbi:MAG TPA: hypothetical protein VN377_02290 [Candidatus Thermoplasmatota archaeon]|nr:hypothetical protein [Candidatus Thermoplasmatota archaeon]